MALSPDYVEDPGPLSVEESIGLLPVHITNQKELNEWEAQNMLAAREWAFARPHKNILQVPFINLLHKKMFCDTWKWAGILRGAPKNPGAKPLEILTLLQKMFNETRVWIDRQTYDLDEIALRVHTRLSQIQPYPQGNGRHSRLFADILLTHYHQKEFTWGLHSRLTRTSVRRQYIEALRKADAGKFSELLRFARS